MVLSPKPHKLPLFLLPIFLSWIPLVLARPSCGCYAASSGHLFQNTKFYDFRRRPTPGIPNAPREENVDGPKQDGYISTPEFSKAWEVQNWPKSANHESPLLMKNDYSNVYIDRNTDSTTGATSKLVLRAKRFENFTSVSEMVFSSKVQHGSFRFRAKVSGASGACGGFFVYKSDNVESDLEILTRDSLNNVHFTNQPNTTIVYDMRSLNAGDGKHHGSYWEYSDGIADRRVRKRSLKEEDLGWKTWRTYRIDWVPKKISFYIDGKHASDLTRDVPVRQDMWVILNIWSDGGSWSGNMPIDDSAFLEIEWIELFYNGVGYCDRNICAIDYDKSALCNGFAGPNLLRPHGWS